MAQWLENAKTRKTFVFCVSGVHRSGNASCMIMCAVDKELAPNRAMDHLQNVRSISGPNERKPHRQKQVSLGEWFDNGGPWTSRAPFLTAGPFLQRPSNFLCFPPTPTGPFVPSPTDSASRSPAGFPQAPRPRPSLFVRRRLRRLPQGGHPHRRHRQGNLFSFRTPTPDPSHRRQSVSLSGFGPLPVPAHACPIPRPPQPNHLDAATSPAPFRLPPFPFFFF